MPYLLQNYDAQAADFAGQQFVKSLNVTALREDSGLETLAIVIHEGNERRGYARFRDGLVTDLRQQQNFTYTVRSMQEAGREVLVLTGPQSLIAQQVYGQGKKMNAGVSVLERMVAVRDHFRSSAYHMPQRAIGSQPGPLPAGARLVKLDTIA
jgi:hypothetical protein